MTELGIGIDFQKEAFQFLREAARKVEHQEEIHQVVAAKIQIAHVLALMAQTEAIAELE